MNASKISLVWVLLSGCLLALPVGAQQEPISAETMAMVKAMTPGEAHAFLAGYVGTWDAQLEVFSEPGQPPVKGTGILERKMILGGRVLHETLTGEISGMPFEGVGHVGFDNVTATYWSTWFDNMSTGVMALEGTIDIEARKAILEGETPEPIAGKKVKMRLEVFDQGEEQITEAYMPIPGKGNMLTMRTVYRRQATAE